MATVITLMCTALLFGYIGSRWQKSRQSTIAKSEARELKLKIREMEKATAFIMECFEDHQDVHKVLNHHMETMVHNLSVAGRVIGLKQSKESRSLN